MTSHPPTRHALRFGAALVLVLSVALLTVSSASAAGTLVKQDASYEDDAHEINPLNGSWNCGSIGCTRVSITRSGSTLTGYVQGDTYPAGTAIRVDGIIYKNSYSNVYWDIPLKSCTGTYCRASFTLPNCGPGTYILGGWSWKSGSSDQPYAETSIVVP